MSGTMFVCRVWFGGLSIPQALGSKGPKGLLRA